MVSPVVPYKDSFFSSWHIADAIEPTAGLSLAPSRNMSRYLTIFALFAICILSFMADAEQPALVIHSGRPSGVMAYRHQSPVNGHVVKAKRQLSPASRLQQMLNEYRALYDQFKKPNKH